MIFTASPTGGSSASVRKKKGGWLALGAGSAKAADQGLEGGLPVAEAVGDLAQRKAVEEISALGFVTAMESLLGLEKELAATLVIHGALATRLIIFKAAPLPECMQLRGQRQEDQPRKRGSAQPQIHHLRLWRFWGQ